MLTNKDREYAQNRKNLWSIFNWTGKGILFFSKNHSLNCGCSMCKAKTKHRRHQNKKERLTSRRELKSELNQI